MFSPSEVSNARGLWGTRTGRHAISSRQLFAVIFLIFHGDIKFFGMLPIILHVRPNKHFPLAFKGQLHWRLNFYFSFRRGRNKIGRSASIHQIIPETTDKALKTNKKQFFLKKKPLFWNPENSEACPNNFPILPCCCFFFLNERQWSRTPNKVIREQ